MKKDRGRIDKYIFWMLALVMTMLLTMILFQNLEVIQRKIAVNQLARQYILRMETVGYLTPEDRDELTEQLNRIGVSGVSYAGTTMIQAGYGNDITLEFRGELSCRETDLTFMFSPEAVDSVISIHEKRMSTAKY